VSVGYRISTVLLKKCVSCGDYQRHIGSHSQTEIPKGKVRGFKKFDKVRYKDNEYFVKGRMTKGKGNAILMDVHGVKTIKQTPCFEKLKRVAARKSWITQEQAIQNIV
jgi:hypothetical protein